MPETKDPEVPKWLMDGIEKFLPGVAAQIKAGAPSGPPAAPPKSVPADKAKEDMLSADMADLKLVTTAMKSVRDRHLKQENEMYAQAIVHLQRAEKFLVDHYTWRKQRS